jgi:hypothetical protein
MIGAPHWLSQIKSTLPKWDPKYRIVTGYTAGYNGFVLIKSSSLQQKDVTVPIMYDRSLLKDGEGDRFVVTSKAHLQSARTVHGNLCLYPSLQLW